MLSPLKYAAAVTLLAFGAVMMLTGGASAESFGTRCVGDRCWAVHCNTYGEDCRANRCMSTTTTPGKT